MLTIVTANTSRKDENKNNEKNRIIKEYNKMDRKTKRRGEEDHLKAILTNRENIYTHMEQEGKRSTYMYACIKLASHCDIHRP